MRQRCTLPNVSQVTLAVTKTGNAKSRKDEPASVAVKKSAPVQASRLRDSSMSRARERTIRSCRGTSPASIAWSIAMLRSAYACATKPRGRANWTSVQAIHSRQRGEPSADSRVTWYTVLVVAACQPFPQSSSSRCASTIAKLHRFAGKYRWISAIPLDSTFPPRCAVFHELFNLIRASRTSIGDSKIPLDYDVMRELIPTVSYR